MRQFVLAWMLLGGAVTVMSGPADAHIFRRPKRGCCETCDNSLASCTCTQTRPVVQTQLQARQVTTYRDVTETHVRNETVIQNVPVTTVKQVTVDEGAYQMVWVPKPVTKQVAETVIQQQAQTRAVPYQVTRRVPQLMTQLVPVQTVQHVTEAIPMTTTWAPPPIAFQAASGCSTCNGQFSTAFAPQYIAPQSSQYIAPQYIAPQIGAAIAPPPAQYTPETALIPTMPAIPVPLPQTARGALPTPANSPEQWQTIPSRPTPGSTPNYESAPSRVVPVPMDEVAEHQPAGGAVRSGSHRGDRVEQPSGKFAAIATNRQNGGTTNRRRPDRGRIVTAVRASWHLETGWETVSVRGDHFSRDH